MNNRIDKERTWIFSPVSNIAIKADIKGKISREEMIEAINITVNNYEMLSQKVVTDQWGNACLEKTAGNEVMITSMNKDWKEMVKEQEKIPFAIDKGEFIRFFYQLTKEGVMLLIIAHHLAGDGLSFSYLLQDILNALSGVKPEYKFLKLYESSRLPEESKLRFPMTCLINSMNKGWKKTGRTFNRNDFLRMFHKYWNSNETVIETEYIENEDYDSIIRYSKENKVSVNTMITTAFIRAAKNLSDVGMAVSIREKGITGMGNYATGISVKYKYQENQSFIKNAEKVQHLIYDKLNNPAKKYFLLQFMCQMEPTLIDAVYFAACGEYNNKTANTFSKMFGYSGNPKGISITNLTKLPISIHNQDYELTDFIFVPPLVLNSQRIIGVASFDRKMAVSLHIRDDEQREFHRRFFLNGIEYLKNINRNN